jgi:hypothetical protein
MKLSIWTIGIRGNFFYEGFPVPHLFFTSFPFLPVQELIKDQVASMYLWPKTLVVPIVDASK